MFNKAINWFNRVKIQIRLRLMRKKTNSTSNLSALYRIKTNIFQEDLIGRISYITSTYIVFNETNDINEAIDRRNIRLETNRINVIQRIK